MRKNYQLNTHICGGEKITLSLVLSHANGFLFFFRFGNKQLPYQNRPLLFHQPPTATTPERVLIQYARRSFTGFGALPRSTDIPPITEAQAEALDTLHFLAEKYAVGLDFRKGDVQYVNNLSIFHARDGFTDSPEKQ